jgi:hypothetical protein
VHEHYQHVSGRSFAPRLEELDSIQAIP